MAEGGPDLSTIQQSRPTVPDRYYDIPLQALQHSTRHELGLWLDPLATAYMNDWRMVAEGFGCRTIEVDNFALRESPTDAVIRYGFRNDKRLGEFLDIILNMGRLDVYEETIGLIRRDVEKYQPVQVHEVSSDNLPFTIGELKSGGIEYFDALVSAHPADIHFVLEMEERMEREQGFKLCIPERDLIIGVTENACIAELIIERCKRVIIVLSHAYVNEEGDQGDHLCGKKKKWQMLFAQAFAPISQKMHKLVPVIVEPNVEVPHVLIPYNASDYSREATRPWFWNRLTSSLEAPTSGGVGYRGPLDPRLGRDIHASNAQSRHSSRSSGHRRRNRSSNSSARTNRSHSQQAATSTHSGRGRSNDPAATSSREIQRISTEPIITSQSSHHSENSMMSVSPDSTLSSSHHSDSSFLESSDNMSAMMTSGTHSPPDSFIKPEPLRVDLGDQPQSQPQQRQSSKEQHKRRNWPFPR